MSSVLPNISIKERERHSELVREFARDGRHGRDEEVLSSSRLDEVRDKSEASGRVGGVQTRYVTRTTSRSSYNRVEPWCRVFSEHEAGNKPSAQK